MKRQQAVTNSPKSFTDFYSMQSNQQDAESEPQYKKYIQKAYITPLKFAFPPYNRRHE